MAKSRVFSRPLPDANVPRNAFDMSKRISLNMPFGALIPVYSHQYIAGSHVKINMRTFFRTAAVNTAAFPQLKLNFEWFAVPLRYLWSYWDNFKLGINDYNSSALLINQVSPGVSGNPSNVPYVFYNNIRRLAFLNKDNTSSYRDAVGYSFGRGAARLCDFLGYGRFDASNNVTDDSLNTGQALNLFKAAAYQKIYFDHFRNTAYESNNVKAYNLDFVTRDVSGGVLPDENIIDFFKLRYANYRKDYFQHIFPSLNFVSSSPTSSLASIPSWIQNAAYNYANSQTQVLSSGNLSPNSAFVALNHTSSNTYTSFTAQSLRALFALDKLQRSSAYAPKHVKEQYEARYGIKFSDKSSFESERIGNFDTDVVIGEVTSTANTGSEGDALGAIGGKGVGASDARKGFVEYTCQEDSIVMCIAYAIPRQQYDSYRWENWNMKLSQNDFFIPEFMNLGLKPLYVKEITNKSASVNNSVVGYQTPYMEYKADVDENHGLFADKDSDLGQFVMHTNQAFSSYGTGVSADYFRVKPSDVDSIFVNAYDGTESTDQLFGQIDFIIPVNQNMSVHGLPSL